MHGEANAGGADHQEGVDWLAGWDRKQGRPREYRRAPKLAS